MWGFFQGIFAFQVIGYQPLKYKNEYEYPAWAQWFGLMLALVSMCCIPLYLVGKLLTLEGPIKEVGIMKMIYCCIDDKLYIGALSQLLENKSLKYKYFFFFTKRYFISNLRVGERMMILIYSYSVQSPPFKKKQITKALLFHIQNMI